MVAANTSNRPQELLRIIIVLPGSSGLEKNKSTLHPAAAIKPKHFFPYKNAH
jgi:hypothetical protein